MRPTFIIKLYSTVLSELTNVRLHDLNNERVLCQVHLLKTVHLTNVHVQSWGVHYMKVSSYQVSNCCLSL